MITKTIEIRDSMTFIPVLAIKLEPTGERDRFLFARAGYGTTVSAQSQYVLLAQLNGGGGKITCDPYDWTGNRSMAEAHRWLVDHFDEIESGAVVDVEFLLGETSAAKTSEARS